MRSPTVILAELEFDLDFRQKWVTIALDGSTAARDENVEYSCGYKLLDDQLRAEIGGLHEVRPAGGLGVGLGHGLRDELGVGLGFGLGDGFGRRSEGFEDGTKECLEDELGHGLGVRLGLGDTLTVGLGHGIGRGLEVEVRVGLDPGRSFDIV